jgi:hypothetical protein
MQEERIREQLFQAPGAEAIWSLFAEAFASKHVIRRKRPR